MPRPRKLYNLKRPKLRQSWHKFNLFNLFRQREPKIGLSSNETFFQQKWRAKGLLRAYHGEHIRERDWQRMFSRRLLSVANMDARYMAKFDGSELAAGRGSGKDEKPSWLNKSVPPKIITPYMNMAFAPMERRLDIAVFRAMFASSARQARNFCVHGHVKVNGKVMHHPTYKLNPGDMFQVDPDMVMFATGRPKREGVGKASEAEGDAAVEPESESKAEKGEPKGEVTEDKAPIQLSAKERKPAVLCGHCGKRSHTEADCWTLHPKLRPAEDQQPQCSHCGKLGHEVDECWTAHPEKKPVHFGSELLVARPQPKAAEKEPATQPVKATKQPTASARQETVEEPETTDEPEPGPTDWKPTKRAIQHLINEARELLQEASTAKMRAKQKRELRAFVKHARKLLSKAGKRNVEQSEIVAELNEIMTKLNLKGEPEEAQSQAPTPAEEAAEPAEPAEKTIEDLTPEEREALMDMLREQQDNPVDLSKPYRTPWTPREYMSPFAFIPRYLEVNQNVCSAVYLRHPVARNGSAEVPTPFGYNVNQLAFNWYLRRR